MQVNQKKGNGNGNGGEEKNMISQVWFKYFPYWPLFMILMLIACAGAYVKLRYATPLYESKASILVKDEKKSGDESKVIEELNQLSNKKIIENEMEVIKSRELMTNVVKTLHLYAPIYEKGRIKDLSAYNSSPVQIQVKNPDSLNPTGKVFFSFDAAKKMVVIDNKPYLANEWVSTPYGTLKFVPKPTYGSTYGPTYFTLVYPKIMASFIAAGLDVSPVSKLSSVITLKMWDEVPRRAEDILNELVNAYNNAAVTDKNTLARNTLVFVEERLGKLKKDLDSIEQKMQHYKTSSGAVDIGSQAAIYLQNIGPIDQKLGDVNVQLSALDQLEVYVKSKETSGGSIVPSTVGVTDPMLTQQLEKLYNAELQREDMKKRVAPNNPMMLAMNDQIEKIRPGILETIKSQKSSLQASRSSLSGITNRYSGMLSSIPKKERDLVDISRDQNIKSGVYNFLLQKREETELALSASIADTRVIDRAQSSFGPVSPNKKKFYMMAVVLAMALGAGLIAAKEMLKRTILFRHEIEAYTSIPIIGEIIYEKGKQPLVIGEGKRTFIAEQFRNLRASLPYIGLNRYKKRLLVTSTISGEGKSFVVANLGVSLAMAGKKVIVLEFDLSDPTLADKLEVSAEKGIADYLNGEIKKEDIIHPTNVSENLWIMPAGTLPDNPSELIMSEKVPELLDYLSANYDYIIIDTAPVGLLSDAYILSPHCDATLYVVRHNHTPKVSIQRIEQNNKINELKNIAIVFNGVRPRGLTKNYGYGYGYGYIHEEKKGKKKKIHKIRVA